MAKRIGIFTSHYLPYLGGVERYTANLAAHLKARGDEVVVITSWEEGLQVKEVMEGIPVWRMPNIPLLQGRFPVSKPNKEFFKIHRQLMKYKFDLVIIQTRFYLHSLYGSYVGKKSKAQVIILDHGTSHMTVDNPFWDRLGALYEHGITELLKKNCDGFYGVSKNCCRWLTHFGIHPKGVLYNAIDCQTIDALLENPIEDFRKKYHISSESLLVTYTGRLVKEKGILSLMKAFDKVAAEKDMALMIAGDGPEMEAVEDLANERMIPLGRLSFEEVIALLAQTDIYCLPTGYPEGFPTSVLEAAACGCYVITTDKGGSRELIPNESYGTLLSDNEENNLAKALIYAAEHEDERKLAAQKAQKRARKYFNWERTAAKVARLCSQRGGE